jgi:hypothetical protein
MKAFLAGVLLLPALAVAQQDYVIVEKKVVCGEVRKVLQELFVQYNEVPVWSGDESGTRYSLLTNEQTRSWTLIQFDETVACVIGAGVNSKEVDLGPRT